MPKAEHASLVELLRELKAGTIVAKQLRREDRRACVEFLMMQGLTQVEIAESIGGNLGTVKNDIRAIRKANALHPSTDLQAEVLGQYSKHVEAVVSRLNRLCRDPDASVADKINASAQTVHALGQFFDRVARTGRIDQSSEHASVNSDLADLLEVVAVASERLNADSPMTSEIRLLVQRSIEQLGPSRGSDRA